MPSSLRKPHYSKDERDCERRSRDIRELVGRNPDAWIPIGRDAVSIAAVELLQSQGVLEIDELQARFKLRALSG